VEVIFVSVSNTFLMYSLPLFWSF